MNNMLIPSINDFKVAFSIASKSLLSRILIVFVFVFTILAMVLMVLGGGFIGLIVSLSLLFMMFLINALFSFMTITLSRRLANEIKPLRNDIAKCRTIITEGSALKLDGKSSNIKKLFSINWMFLTESALEYYPGNILMNSVKPTAILLDEIVSINNNGESCLVVQCKNNKYEFYVWHAYIWVEKLKEEIQKI